MKKFIASIISFVIVAAVFGYAVKTERIKLPFAIPGINDEVAVVTTTPPQITTPTTKQTTYKVPDGGFGSETTKVTDATSNPAVTTAPVQTTKKPVTTTKKTTTTPAVTTPGKSAATSKVTTTAKPVTTTAAPATTAPSNSNTTKRTRRTGGSAVTCSGGDDCLSEGNWGEGEVIGH